jgi:hypothetical protein
MAEVLHGDDGHDFKGANQEPQPAKAGFIQASASLQKRSGA